MEFHKRARMRARIRDSILLVSTPNPDNGRNLSCFLVISGMGNVFFFFFFLE